MDWMNKRFGIYSAQFGDLTLYVQQRHFPSRKRVLHKQIFLWRVQFGLECLSNGSEISLEDAQRSAENSAKILSRRG